MEDFGLIPKLLPSEYSGYYVSNVSISVTFILQKKTLLLRSLYLSPPTPPPHLSLLIPRGGYQWMSSGMAHFLEQHKIMKVRYVCDDRARSEW